MRLFERFPSLKARLPRLPLGAFPTPIEQLSGFGHDSLWIKREDLSSPYGGGNKVRKLEFTLADALRRGAKKIVTFGGLGTNHGVATATFGVTLGLATRALLYRQPVTVQVRRALLEMHQLGAELRCYPTLLRAGAAFYTTQRVANPGAYFLMAGGSSPLGNIGVANAMFELREQIDAGVMPEPDCVYVALGSGGTMTGLSLGALLAGLKCRVIGVRVSLDRSGPLRFTDKHTVRTMMQRAYALLRALAPDVPELEIPEQHVLNDYFGAGYGAETPEGREAIVRAQAHADMRLDGTYTAKTFAAVLEAVRRSKHAGETVLYWHTYHPAEPSATVERIDYRSLPRDFHWVFEADPD
jgi:D-cysteine desulfhydrase